MVRAALLSTVIAAVGAQDPDIYNQMPSTRKGCTCQSECKTTLAFYCNVDEFCKVDKNQCPDAEWSVTEGYYDWCVFQPDGGFESRSAAEKQQMLLSKVYQDTTPGAYPGTLSVLTGILGESVWTTFDAGGDVFPHDGRTKYIHSVGVVGGVRFVSSGNHPYKGLFEGAEHGLVRFSSAKEPGSEGFTAGMGIKFLRDGRPSANFVAMYTLDGQPCEEANFFQHEWSNHIPMTDNFGLKIIAAKFWQASYCPLKVGISDLASPAYQQAAQAGTFPFQLIFAPKINSDCNCQDYSGCLQNLQHIPEGTDIFEVFALESPGADRQSIGTITLTSALKTGKFGDEELYFRHQRMEEDFAINPHWLDSIDKANECGMSVASAEFPTLENGCNSPFKPSTMLEDDLIV
jgi:hypothetical protein